MTEVEVQASTGLVTNLHLGQTEPLTLNEASPDGARLDDTVQVGDAPGTLASLDPPPPISTGASPRAASGRRGVYWLARARVSACSFLYDSLPGPIPGSVRWL